MLIYYLYDLLSKGHGSFSKKQRSYEATTTQTMVNGEEGWGNRCNCNRTKTHLWASYKVKKKSEGDKTSKMF